MKMLDHLFYQVSTDRSVVRSNIQLYSYTNGRLNDDENYENLTIRSPKTFKRNNLRKGEC